MLNDARIRGLKPRQKPYKVADRDGLYLFVQPSGSNLWRFDYRFLKNRKTLSVAASEILIPAPLASLARQVVGSRFFLN